MAHFWSVCSILLLVLASVYSQGIPECLSYSQVPTAVAKVYAQVGASGSPFTGVSTSDGVLSALAVLVNVAGSSANPADSLYVGTDTHDWYAVNYIGGSVWTLQVVNSRVYGDSKQRTAYFDSSASTTVGLVGTTVGVAYDAVSRPWYSVVDGWSTYAFFTNGKNGSTYHQRFPGGVIGGDRNFAEPCGPCWEGSLAVPIASLVRFAPGQAARDHADWKVVVRSILTIFGQLKNSYLSGAYVGTDEGRFYAVSDCKVDPSQCSGINTPYVATVSAPGLTSVGTAYSFPLAADGTFGAQVGTYAYNPTLRPWYILGNGWTQPYVFAAGSSLTARTYALQIQGGVVAVDRLDGEPCNGCAAPAAAPAPAPAPASQSYGTSININFAQLFAGFR